MVARSSLCRTGEAQRLQKPQGDQAGHGQQAELRAVHQYLPLWKKRTSTKHEYLNTKQAQNSNATNVSVI
jgi:polyribonucleotide nucleotidyltransferase